MKTWDRAKERNVMVKIILCDDDPFILKIIQEQIEDILLHQGLDGKIVCVSTSGKDMISYLRSHPQEHLFFLDLDFGNNEFNGIDLAKQIRSITPEAKIVFVTNHYELALDVLKSGTEPFGFIEKTTDLRKMNRSCYQYLYLANKQITVHQKKKDTRTITICPGFDEEVHVPIQDILYVEAVKTKSHCICYHTINGSSITVRESMEHAMKRLGDGFIRSHRSVIVQKCHMIGMEDGMIRLINGAFAPCSFRLRNELKGMIYGNKK